MPPARKGRKASSPPIATAGAFCIERPIAFFGLIGAALALIAVLLSIPLVLTFLQTGLVPRFPTAVLIVGLVMVASLSFVCGLILDTVVRGRREVKRLAYLSHAAPSDFITHR
jgi:uncharacterized membrane protein YedE/YeeE